MYWCIDWLIDNNILCGCTFQTCYTYVVTVVYLSTLWALTTWTTQTFNRSCTVRGVRNSSCRWSARRLTWRPGLGKCLHSIRSEFLPEYFISVDNHYPGSLLQWPFVHAKRMFDFTTPSFGEMSKNISHVVFMGYVYFGPWQLWFSALFHNVSYFSAKLPLTFILCIPSWRRLFAQQFLCTVFSITWGLRE